MRYCAWLNMALAEIDCTHRFQESEWSFLCRWIVYLFWCWKTDLEFSAESDIESTSLSYLSNFSSSIEVAIFKKAGKNLMVVGMMHLMKFGFV